LSRPLVPYTTLFRSSLQAGLHAQAGRNVRFTRSGISGQDHIASLTAALMQDVHNLSISHQSVLNYANSVALAMKPFVDHYPYELDRKSTRLNSSHVS